MARIVCASLQTGTTGAAAQTISSLCFLLAPEKTLERWFDLNIPLSFSVIMKTPSRRLVPPPPWQPRRYHRRRPTWPPRRPGSPPLPLPPAHLATAAP